MAVGRGAYTKGDVDGLLGDAAATLRDAMVQFDTLASRLNQVSDQQLANLGYTPDDITTIRACLQDVNDLMLIFKGQLTLQQTRDFRTNIKQLYGLK